MDTLHNSSQLHFQFIERGYETMMNHSVQCLECGSSRTVLTDSNSIIYWHNLGAERHCFLEHTIRGKAFVLWV